MGECRDGDWENIVTHALFTSNPDETITGFQPESLKRLKMLLGSSKLWLRVESCKR
jgi:hypothetical protein